MQHNHQPVALESTETTNPMAPYNGNTPSNFLNPAGLGPVWSASPGAKDAGDCSSSEARSGRSLEAQYRRLDCACVPVAFAADRAGSSFLGRKDSSAMESYDVIANQPVVIDNVSSVFPISKESVLSSREDRFRGFSLGRLLFVTGPACQAGSAAAAPVLLTAIVCRQGGQQRPCDGEFEGRQKEEL